LDNIYDSHHFAVSQASNSNVISGHVELLFDAVQNF